MVKGEGGAMKKKVDVDLHDIVQNLPLKAAKGEVEVDWEESVRHHVCSGLRFHRASMIFHRDGLTFH